MPVNLNVEVFENSPEGALELKNFILANKSACWQYNDLENLDEDAVRALGDAALFRVICPIMLLPKGYPVRQPMLWFDNGVVLVSIRNSQASSIGSTNLGNRLSSRMVGEDGYALDFEYDEGYYQSIPLIELMRSIIASEREVAMPCLECASPSDVENHYDQGGIWLLFRPSVAIDRSSENYAEYVSSSVSAIKQSVQEALDSFTLLDTSGIPVPPRMQDSNAEQVGQSCISL